MLVIYYETKLRNEESGETLFTAEPQEKIEHSINGLILCQGKISIYAAGTPLEVTGTWKENHYIITKCEIPKKNVHIVLSRYLKDTQIKQFIKELETKKLLTFLKTAECEKLLGQNYTKIRCLYESEETGNYLLAHGVAADRIEAVLAEHIPLEKIKKFPYEMLGYKEISLLAIDRIAKEEEIPAYDNHRISVWVQMCTEQFIRSGSSIVLLEELTQHINRQMKKSVYPVTVSKSMVLSKIIDSKSMCLEYKDNRVYAGLKRIAEEEKSIITNIKRLNGQKYPKIKKPEITDSRANEEQKACFHALETSGIKIITGPPGSGKTTIIKGLITSFKKEYPKARVKLCATTGRASKILKMDVGIPASTIHRMLDIRPYSGKQNVIELDADLIVADEFSMCGTQLFSYLLSSVKSGSILILVGDEDQLQSVEYGNVLHDLIKSKLFEVYHLTQVFRQGGMIYKNAQKVNSGEKNLHYNDYFKLKRFPDKESMYNELKNTYKASDSVVSPIKEGCVGTKSVNALIQSVLSRKDPILIYGQKKYYRNDHICMINTNYEKGYINGDTGKILNYRDGIATIQIEGEKISLTRSELKDMDLNYAITIHRSQGGETEHITILLPKCGMLSRRLLYTAITRAKQDVFIYSENDALETAIQNTKEKVRETMLLEKLNQSAGCI